MNKNSLTIAEAISKVQEGFGSVYTKEDVMTLLQAIKLPEPQLTPISERLSELKDGIVDRILDRIDNDIVDYSSAEFEINYGNTLELSSVDISHRLLGNIIEGELEDVICDLRAEEEKNDVEVGSVEESSLEGKNEEIEG